MKSFTVGNKSHHLYPLTTISTIGINAQKSLTDPQLAPQALKAYVELLSFMGQMLKAWSNLKLEKKEKEEAYRACSNIFEAAISCDIVYKTIATKMDPASTTREDNIQKLIEALSELQLTLVLRAK